jgi:hypothetical protein
MAQHSKYWVRSWRWDNFQVSFPHHEDKHNSLRIQIKDTNNKDINYEDQNAFILGCGESNRNRTINIYVS